MGSTIHSTNIEFPILLEHFEYTRIEGSSGVKIDTQNIEKRYRYLSRISITWEVQRTTYIQVDIRPLTFADSDKLIKERLRKIIAFLIGYVEG